MAKKKNKAFYLIRSDDEDVMVFGDKPKKINGEWVTVSPCFCGDLTCYQEDSLGYRLCLEGFKKATGFTPRKGRIIKVRLVPDA